MFRSASGSENNKVKIGGVTELFGDPSVKLEKPYTIIHFPGGSIELSRCDGGSYWLHAATHSDGGDVPAAQITQARIDSHSRYLNDANKALAGEVEVGDVNHVAFRFQPAQQ